MKTHDLKKKNNYKIKQNQNLYKKKFILHEYCNV
jgi:hypothetical protein